MIKTTPQNCIIGTLTPYSAWGANANNPDPDLAAKRDIQHLFNRMTFGANQLDINWALTKTPSEVVDTLVDLAVGEINVPAPGLSVHRWADKSSINDMDMLNKCNNYLARVALISREWMDGMIGKNSTADSVSDQETDKAKRFKYKMAMFWHDHFAVDRRASQASMMWYKYTLIYNAVGNFKQFAKDIGLTGAMLDYLNAGANFYRQNPDWIPNENYARELLELFVMGKSAGNDPTDYTLQDIQELAKLFSGWRTEYWSPTAAQFREFYFQPNLHDWSTKIIFGESLTPTIPSGVDTTSTVVANPEKSTNGVDFVLTCNNGIVEPLLDINGNPSGAFLEFKDHSSGLVYLGDKNSTGIKDAYDEYEEAHDIIFGERNGSVISTARQLRIAKYICEKLYQNFIYEEIDQTIVDGLAATFVASNWELGPVLKQLFKSEHFFSAAARGAQIQSHLGVFFNLYTTLGLEFFVDYFPHAWYFDSAYYDPNNPYGYYDWTYGTTVPGCLVVWNVIINSVANMGHNLFQPPNVAGWPGYRTWINEYTFYKMRDVLANSIANDFNDTRTPTRERWRQLMIALTGNSTDPVVITKAVAEHFILVDLLPEQLNAAVCAFKDPVPSNYFDNGLWNLYYDEVPQQFISLMQYLLRIPENFMT